MLFRNGGATARTFNACTISAIIDVVSDVHGVVSLFRVLPHLARSCRLRHCSKVGRYLGYTDRDRGLISAAAFDPNRKLPAPFQGGNLHDLGYLSRRWRWAERTL
jgi:hypothetical protein